MASLKLRNGTWHLCWRWRGKVKGRTTGIDHDGKFKDGKPVPPTAVKRELVKLELELEQGNSPSTVTLDRLLEDVVKEYETAEFKSLAALKCRLPHIRAHFGNLRADRISKRDLADYADFRRKEGAAQKTIKHELSVIAKALASADIGVPKMPPLKLPPPRKGFFNDTSIAAVCRFLPDYLRAPTMFGYYTGWRREEIFGMEWPAIDFGAGEIRLWDSKNDDTRVFPMDAVKGLRALMEGLAPALNDDGVPVSNFVFTRKRKSGSVRRIVEFRKAWATACAKAGYPSMIFHDLRRAAARNLENARYPRTNIMAWMGHKSDSMFLRYAMQSAADLDMVKQRLEETKKAGQP